MTRPGGKRALKEGTMAALKARPPEPSPLSIASFGFDPVRAGEPALDAALLHLLDHHITPPAWAKARWPSLVKRGLARVDHEGDCVLVFAGAEEQARLAGRESGHEGVAYDAPPCPCAICDRARADLGAPLLARDDDYRAFLEAKIKMAPFDGFEITERDVNPMLAPHTKAIVAWSLRGGRRAIFADFGLFKTATQIELMRLIGAREKRPALIVMPLGVRHEFANEAEVRFKGKFKVKLAFVRSTAEVTDLSGKTIYLTNYETVREGKLDLALFVAATLDEAAVLRSYGSKTYQEFLPAFESVLYRFVATATPSPNRLKELIHYAGFLGVMDTGQALTRFFQRNSEQANDLTLYPHKEEEFWLWVHSWAIFLQKPSDIGFSDEGFVLPPLDVHWVEVETNHAAAGAEKDGQGRLFRDAALGLQAAAAEKRDSMPARIEAMSRIVRETTDDQIVIWCHLNDEQAAIEAELADQNVSFVSLTGSQPIDQREDLIASWKAKEATAFVSKPEMYGAGVNMQQSHTMIFAGVNYSFHDIFQAVHRVQRFGQRHVCNVYFIYSEAERLIVADIKRKWALHNDMRSKMADIIKTYGLDHAAMADSLKRSLGVSRVDVKSDRFTIANNDCVAETRSMAENSVDLVVTSIPFSNQYEYCAAYEDMGHTDDNEHFWSQMDFLTPELLRILKPGRRLEVHVKDRILFGNVTGKGAPTVSAFHAEAIFHFQKHGFDYMGMVTVVTDVVRENNQTYRLGWSENAKDGTKMGSGMPEYILHLRKPQTDRSKGYADDPVRKSKDAYTRAHWQVDAHAFWRSSGNRFPTVDELAALGPAKLATLFTTLSLAQVYDYEFHVRIGEELEARGALPSSFMSLAPGSHHAEVWHDINRMLTLNSEQSRRRVEMHVCPLQFDIVDRLIEMYSEPDELVFDPFAGIGTVPYRAILKGRRGAGCELNPTSFLDAAHYCRAAEKQHDTPTLFKLEELDAEQSA